MSRTSNMLLPVLIALALAVAGCGRHAEGDGHDHGESETGHGHADEHGHGHEGEGETGASFTEGKGVLLRDEAAAQIGLQTAEVVEQKLAVTFDANARVYETAHAHSPRDGQRAHHDSHATAILSAHMASFLKSGQEAMILHPDGTTAAGRLHHLDAETARAIGQVEAILDVPDPDHRLDFGTFIKVRFSGGEREVMVIPRAALLDAATGTFVYVKNGDHFLRTPVKVGVTSDGWVEVTDGLFEGDVVVSQGATDLWLIELRFTKGGGHSH